MPRHSGALGGSRLMTLCHGAVPGTGTPGSLAESALHKQMARAGVFVSLSCLLACRPAPCSASVWLMQS
jgi:hypothetical protein